jgi:hypothetical protein
MPTQEERLGTVEQAITILQRETGKSIREVNENSTIMLGLLQTLTQESKQTGLRMEMLKIRMDQLETKFDAHTALLNEHTRVLSDHTTRFDRLEHSLPKSSHAYRKRPSKAAGQHKPHLTS